MADSTGSVSAPAILADGTGGAMLVWEDRRGPHGQIYAQRIRGDGTRDSLWAESGVPVATGPPSKFAPMIGPDGNGGAIVTWSDAASQATGGYFKGGTTYRLIADHLGSVRLVVSAADGSIAQRIDYDAYGRDTVDSNPGFQCFGFAGGLTDTATGLIRLGARDYSPGTGSWEARDPALAGGGLSFYAYVSNDPVNYYDPSGLARVRNRTSDPLIVSGGTGRGFGSGGKHGFAIIPPDGKYHGGASPLPTFPTYEEARQASTKPQSEVQCPTSENDLLYDIDYYYNQSDRAVKVLGDAKGPRYDVYLDPDSRDLRDRSRWVDWPGAILRDYLRDLANRGKKNR